MPRSSFDRVKKHLSAQGDRKPVPVAIHDDLECLSRRCDEIRSLDQGFGFVELSPYMLTLLRVSGLESQPVSAPREMAGTTVAAGS